MKKIFTFITLSFSLIFLTLISGQVSAFDFDDVENSHPNRIAIEYLDNVDILKGQGNSSNFDPQGILNRAEWATIISRGLNINPDPSQYSSCFPDVTDEWFAAVVCFSQAQGWIKGYQAGPEAGLFIPHNILNTAEILVILSRVYDWPIDQGLYWYSGAMAYALEAGIVSSGTYFDQHLSRAEAAEIFFRTLSLDQYSINKYDPLLGELMLSESIKSPDPSISDQDTTPKTTITLSTYSDLPPKATIPRGALYVPVLRFQLETDRPVTLSELQVKRTSVGSYLDLSIGRLMIDGVVLQERPFTSDHLAYWVNLNYFLIPNRTYIVEINVDFSIDAQAISDHQFKVDSTMFRFEESEAEVIGSEISGQSYFITDTPIETIAVSNPSKKLKLPYMESEGEIIGKFTITAGAHDVIIKRIVLEDAGSISSKDFKNFSLSVGSQQISFLANIDTSRLDFYVGDLYLEKGRDKSFIIRADILTPRKLDVIRFYIESPEDIYAFDLEYGFGTQVDNQFDYDTAWCVGAEDVECPAEGLRKRCSDEDIENKVVDCIETDDSASAVIQECDDRLAPVCGKIEGKRYSFTNLCHAEASYSTSIATGPCDINDIICRTDYLPVCGQIEEQCETAPCPLINHTFSNRCHADHAAAQNISDGACSH